MSKTVRGLIRYEAVHDKRDRRVVALKLQKEIKELGEPVPQEGTLLKAISRERKSNDPQEAPWDLATLDEYPIPSEALPSVVRAWGCQREFGGTEFTVRDAKWAARLYAIYKDQDISALGVAAQSAAMLELMGDGAPPPRYLANMALLELYEASIGADLTEERREEIMQEKRSRTRQEFSETYPWLAYALKFGKEAQDERSRSQEVQELL